MEYQGANRQALRSLQGALNARRVVGLVGAGCSVRAGYPTWSELLEQMEKAIQLREPLLAEILSQLKKEGDVLWRAQEYRRLLGEGYGSLLRETFGDEAGQVTRFHKKLVQLPLRHILTTNYDPILELAHTAVRGEAARWIHWDDCWDLREFIFRSGDPRYSRRYVYLHGRYNKPDSIILTEQDYQQRYVLSDRDADRIAALLATQQVLSIGFSLSDFDVMELFRQVKARTGPGRPHHYALLPLDEDQDPGLYRRRLNGKFGVEPVFYPWTQDHAGLDDLLDELSEPPPKSGQALGIRSGQDGEDLGPKTGARDHGPKEGFAAPTSDNDSLQHPSVPEPAPSPARPAAPPRHPLRTFVSYSIKDTSSLKELKKHVGRLGKPSLLDSWTDREVRAGSEWRQDLFDQLEKADLILLLVSPAFLATDYVYHVELKRALERQESGDAQLIPIILRPTDWSSAPFANLQALPRKGKPITEWENTEEAWEDIATGLQSVLAP